MGNRDAATILREAKRLLRKPQQWTQGDFATWTDGEEASMCYCANGALLAVTDGTCNLITSGASLHLSLAARARGFETASKFNDAPGRKHAEVLALFDEAIARAETDAARASLLRALADRCRLP